MKVFISWSGKRSRALANALRDWLPMVLQYVEPWVSDKDISAGDRWAQAIAGELEASNFGIICITPENLHSEWILFESGALSKSMLDAKVIPLLFGLELSDLSGPLSQFQAQKLEQSGVMEVVKAINKVAEAKTSEQIVDQLVPALWPRLQETLEGIPDKESSEKHMRPQHEILEELVTGVRGINSRMRDLDPELNEREFYHRRRKMRRFHPRMLDELFMMVGEDMGAPIQLLILAGLYREDFPWLSEILSEAYRELRDGSPENAERTLSNIMRIVKHTMHSKMFHELSGGSKELMMMTEELPMLLDMSLHRILSERRSSEPQED
ncbi:toll/interleukin-1 receptor domain-containing protein [Alloalcanivorax xenomutans]|uniref:toll/interleukin-1 receptor domain-containing protein n=1 Tax=Alloalcanivorax xenomutans TaxID=1094342 RepID=UPI003BAC3C69